MTTDDPIDEQLKVTPPKQWATGFPAVTHALQYSLEQTSPRRTAVTLLTIRPSPTASTAQDARGQSRSPASGT